MKEKYSINSTNIGISVTVKVPSLTSLCSHCFGTGKQKAMQMAMTYDGGSIRDKDTSVKCEACKGTGFVK